MTDQDQHSIDDDIIDRSLLRLNAVAAAVGLGLLCGVGLFLTTIFLALRDGPMAGPHLSLLSQYFPGYSVTVLGSFVGFVYAAILGGLAGLILSAVYNRLTR